ncbi:MAG: chemotaxis protein CheW [Phycisphaerae bacterium]|nr:MAG: chemotaxis protein CheW [Phycisphaerae bacterium]
MSTMQSTQTRAGKYLTFQLGSEGYGIPIGKVKSIIGYMDITAVPRTPPHVRGVINLRGQVISVIDLRSRLGMPTTERTDETCIVVVETQKGSRIVNTGLIVDKVSEVPHIPEDAIEDAPEFGSTVETQFILGMAKINSTVKILLDIDRIVRTGDDLSSENM